MPAQQPAAADAPNTQAGLSNSPHLCASHQYQRRKPSPRTQTVSLYSDGTGRGTAAAAAAGRAAERQGAAEHDGDRATLQQARQGTSALCNTLNLKLHAWHSEAARARLAEGYVPCAWL